MSFGVFIHPKTTPDDTNENDISVSDVRSVNKQELCAIFQCYSLQLFEKSLLISADLFCKGDSPKVNHI